jgi:hypothetical protein
MTDHRQTDPDDLAREVAALRAALTTLTGHKVFRSHATVPRLLWFNFLRGLALGLGSVVGATILVSALVFALSSIDFVPVIGEWATDIIDVIEAGNTGARPAP